MTEREYDRRQGVPHFHAAEFEPRQKDYVVLIPIINEGDRIRRELERAARAVVSETADIVLCDGGSTDGSTDPELLKGLQVNTLLTKQDAGRQGAQLRMGFWWALERGYQGIITVDGNNKDSIEDVPSFVEKLQEGYDFIQGSRFVAGGRAVNTPWIRSLSVRLLHAPVISLTAQHRFTDTTNNFRGYSARYLRDERVQPLRDVFMTYELLAYLSVRATQLGMKACEIPVTRAYPAKGKTPTKISFLKGNAELLRILFANARGAYAPAQEKDRVREKGGRALPGAKMDCTQTEGKEGRIRTGGRHDHVLAGAVLAGLLGVLAFLLLYGAAPLRVTNDAWIMAGYDETDIIQHYSGWLAFRNSDWSFPIGMASDMACGSGTCISFTDSIPWAAVICKLFRFVLPETFQYFGWYALLCYVLQGVAAYRLVRHRTRHTAYSVLGSVLFLFAPILLERSLRHTALGSQWLILFAMDLWLCHRQTPKTGHYGGFLALLVLAIGIHPYFLPMTAVFLVLSAAEDLRRKSCRGVILAAADLLVTYLTGCVLGVLGTNVQTSRDGYGYYSMNLNALWNPSSLGGYRWSSFLSALPQTLGNYDGFNYLGVGIMAGLLAAAVLAAGQKLAAMGRQRAAAAWDAEQKDEGRNKNGAAVQRCGWWRRNGAAVLLLLACWLFAASNVVTWNDTTVLTIPLPESVLEICGIFRASSQLFYPVYYMIFLCVIDGLWRLIGRKGRRESSAWALAALGAVVLLQLYDLHPCIAQKHAQMAEKASSTSVLNEEPLNDLMAHTDYFVNDMYYDGTRKLSIPALKHGMKLAFSTANSGDYTAAGEMAAERAAYIKETGDIGTTLVITSDWENALQYLQHDNIGYYEREGAYYLCDRSLSMYVTGTAQE